jgi:multisubunit Na+/H+ antiporter MnhB subunit
MESFILRVATKMLVGLILVFAFYLLFRGHHAPGGGFAAALVAGTGFSLFAITEGIQAVKQALRIGPRVCIAFGLLLAIAAGVPAVLAGQPFLTGVWWPAGAVQGAVTVGTPVIFDIGVFLVVFGTIVVLVLHLEEQ